MFFKNDNKVKINSSQIGTYVGADTKIEGTVITKSSLRVDGTIVGGVCADGSVVVSKSGHIKGNVIAQNIIVAGVVNGNMQIKDKTNIEPTGAVYGDISTNKILIDEQSKFQGNCNMNIARDGKRSGHGNNSRADMVDISKDIEDSSARKVEKQEMERKEPEKREAEKKEPEKREPEKRELEKAEPKKAEPIKEAVEKTEQERKTSEKKESEKALPDKKAVIKKEPIKKEPIKKEPIKKEPVKRETPKRETPKRESLKREIEKRRRV